MHGSGPPRRHDPLTIGLIGLHVAAAGYHQIFRRDRLRARMGVGPAADLPR